MLIDTVDPSLQISKSVLWTVVICVGVAVALALWLVIKAQRNRPAIGQEGMVGKTAEVRANGFVYVDGALWKAQCDEDIVLGDRVEIIAKDKLTFKVKKLNS